MAKSEEELKRELNLREILGEKNEWKKDVNSIPNVASSGPKGFASAVIDHYVASQSNHNRGSSRKTVLVAEEKLSSYEAYQESQGAQYGKTIKHIIGKSKKLRSRCAENNESSVLSPMYYDKEIPQQNFAKFVSVSLHPSKNQLDDGFFYNTYNVGDEVNITYVDEDRREMKINNKITTLFTKVNYVLPNDFVSGESTRPFNQIPGIPFLPSAESENSTLSLLDTGTDSKEIRSDLWTPKYNPLAIGTTKYLKINKGSLYGYRNHPVEKKRKFHSGVDLWVGSYLPVVACASGVISAVLTVDRYEKKRWGENNGTTKGQAGGAYVQVKHEGNKPGVVIYTIYCHLMKTDVKRGQKVQAGQVLGIMGGGHFGYLKPKPGNLNPKVKLYCGIPGAGTSTGAHLHFGIKFKEGSGELKNIDPNSFLYPDTVVLSDEKMEKFKKDNRKLKESWKKPTQDKFEKIYGPLTKKV